MARSIFRAICTLGLLILISGLPAAFAAPVKDVLEEFPPPQKDFKKHVEDVRAYLLATQLDGRSPHDVEYNLPFELSANDEVPYRGQYFLIHGLNDSPAVWQDIAQSLADRGFDVRAILLPGHGNTPEAQLKVSWHQWLEAARLQLDYWRSPDTPLYLGGFSLGGVIACIDSGDDGRFRGRCAQDPTTIRNALQLSSPASASVFKRSDAGWHSRNRKAQRIPCPTHP